MATEFFRINIQVAKSYGEGVKELVSGRVDFSRLEPSSYVITKEKVQHISFFAMENKKSKKRFAFGNAE